MKVEAVHGLTLGRTAIARPETQRATAASARSVEPKQTSAAAPPGGAATLDGAREAPLASSGAPAAGEGDTGRLQSLVGRIYADLARLGALEASPEPAVDLSV